MSPSNSRKKNYIEGDELPPVELCARFGIPRDEIASFHQCIRVYPPRELIILEGEVDQALFLIRSGKVDVVKKSHENKHERLGSIEAVNFMGEMSLLNDEPRSATVISAEEEVLVYVITRPNLGLIMTHPKWAELLIARLAKNLAQSNKDKIASASQIDQLRDEIDQLKDELAAQKIRYVELTQNVHRTFSTIMFFEKAVQELSVVGSRSWTYLKTFREVSQSLVERWIPGQEITPDAADVGALLSCLQALGRQIPEEISVDLLKWLQNQPKK